MVPPDALIERGVFQGNKAVRIDGAALRSPDDAALYAEAKAAYIAAIENLSAAAKATPNLHTARLCQGKCVEYMVRAEALQAWLKANDGRRAQAEEERLRAQAEAKARAEAKAKAAPGAGTGAKKKKSGGAGKKSESVEKGGDGEKKEDVDEEEEENEGDADAKAMRAALMSAVVTETPNVRWSDVAGLTGAKDSLKEAVILPKKFPQMFGGNRKPWKGILLYGPPGTGKSFLAKAVATEADSFFISVSSSDLVSKWQGESEKLVKELFVLARERAPSIVFIDEIDSLVSSRSDNESESSRRIKTEFLVQMDGVGNATEGVLVLGATNIPWGLDDALLRRMERRVYIPLPDAEARAHILSLNVADTPNELTDADYQNIAERAEGYSGSDLAVVTRDAIMQPVRIATSATHFKEVPGDGAGDGKMLTPCSPGDRDGKEVEGGIMALPSAKLMLPPVLKMHFELALANSKPSVGPESLTKMEEFTASRGQEGR